MRRCNEVGGKDRDVSSEWRENWWRYVGGFVMGVALFLSGLKFTDWHYWPPFVVLVVFAEIAYTKGQADA